MKLLFCENCWDVFKLKTSEERSCECGKVRGGYDKDGHHAWTNGKGISLAFNNHHIYPAIQKMKALQANGKYDDFYSEAQIACWVRPNDGAGNPRSVIIEKTEA